MRRLDAIERENAELRAKVSATQRIERAPASRVASLVTCTSPNARNEYPPVPTRDLVASMFTSMKAHKVPGGYTPPQLHSLTSYRMYSALSIYEGKEQSATSTLLSFCNMAAVRFAAHPAVLVALFSGRLGCDGATLMMFKPLTLVESLVRSS